MQSGSPDFGVKIRHRDTGSTDLICSDGIAMPSLYFTLTGFFFAGAGFLATGAFFTAAFAALLCLTGSTGTNSNCTGPVGFFRWLPAALMRSAGLISPITCSFFRT